MMSYVCFFKSAIKYELDELSACKALLDQCLQDDPQTIINYAAISFKEVGTTHIDIHTYLLCIYIDDSWTSACRTTHRPSSTTPPSPSRRCAQHT
jgi:hypothetical protein